MMVQKYLNIGGGLLALTCISQAASAALVIDITKFTSTELVGSVTGTIGFNTSSNDQPGWVAIKPNYSANIGTHVEWMTTVGHNDASSSVDGVSTSIGAYEDATSTYGDALALNNPNGVQAAFTGNEDIQMIFNYTGGVFDPAAVTSWDVIVGYSEQDADWGTLVASTPALVPVPPSVVMLAPALFGLFGYSRHKKGSNLVSHSNTNAASV